MSLGYAEKLSYKEDVGDVGMSEMFDSPDDLQQKIKQLAKMIKKSKHLVAFTGAGISTSCGIPDFRGPKGVWTLQREGKGIPEASLPFHRASPSLTHMALVGLEKAGILKFVISQNVDSLHLRSGIPRQKLSELHGNSFREVCPKCGKEYLRDFELETVGLKETSRRCIDAKCGAKLRDSVLDWEDELPPTEMKAAEKNCRMSDLVLCLGTSLQITPACNLPLKSIRNGGKMVIVNLQQTPKDNRASLVIRGFVDKVMSGVLHLLKMQIPPYVRVDLFQIIFNQFRCTSETKYAKWSLRVTSVHGEKALIPFIESVEVTFPERPELKTAVLHQQPFFLKRETLKSRPLHMVLSINFSEGCGCKFISIDYPVDFEASTEDINEDKNIVFQQLRDMANEDRFCGQSYVIERKLISDSGKTISTYAVATNIAQFDELSPSKTAHISNGEREKMNLGNGVDTSTASVPTKKASIDDINQDKNIMIQQLRDMTNKDQFCGKSSVIERKLISDSGKTISTYDVATNIAQYGELSPSKTTHMSNGEKEKVNFGSGVDISRASVHTKKVRVH